MAIDWVGAHPEAHLDVPAGWLDDAQVAAELGRIQRDRARQTAREAQLILRLAELRPDTDDPAPGTPGARRRSWRKTDPEFAGVSEFFPDEVAHAINLGRGTAAFRARRALVWRDNLPATFAALRRGEVDERRAGVLADALQGAAPELARAVEAVLLPEAGELSLARLRARALELLAELDADAVEERRAEAQRAADVRVYPTADGMADPDRDDDRRRSGGLLRRDRPAGRDGQGRRRRTADRADPVGHACRCSSCVPPTTAWAGCRCS